MPQYTDNLDGTSGDFLRLRSGWTRNIGVDEITLTSGGSGYYTTGGAVAADGTWHSPTSQPSGNDQFMEAFILRGSGGNPMPLGVRVDLTSALGQGYLAGLDTTTRVRLFRRSAAGALTVLGSYTHSNATDFETNKVRLEVSGTSVSLSFMGSIVVGPVTDVNIASGSVGILTRGGSVIATTPTIDDVAWGDIAAAGNSGTLTGTLAALTTTSQAQLKLSGSMSKTLAALTSSAQAKVYLRASVTQTLQALTVTATGVLTSSGLTGSVNKTLQALTSTAAAKVYLRASVNKTLQALTSTAAAKVYLRASVNRTLQALTVQASSSNTVTGSVSKTLQALTSTATAKVYLRAALSSTLQALTSSAYGNLGAGGLSGSLVKTLQPVVSQATGKLYLKAAVSQGLAALTSAATGRLRISAAVNKTLQALTAGIIGRWPNAIQPASSRTITLQAPRSNVIVVPSF